MGSLSCLASPRWRLPALAATAHATQSRDRGGGALLLALGLVARALSDRRRTIPGRDRCAGGAQGRGKFQRIDRVSVKFPPTDNNRIGTVYTSMCGTLVRVEIERATGVLRIAKAYSVLECGQPLVPEVVLGPGAGRLCDGRRLRVA